MEQGIIETRRFAAANASGGVSAAPIYNAIIDAISDLDLAGNILDLGAGTGCLSRILCYSDRIEQLHAVDIVGFPTNLKHPKLQWIFSDLNREVPLVSESYDIIVAAEIIEHLENPRFIARECFRLLKPGGTAILSTPNNESWRALLSVILRGHFIAFTDRCYPAHITALLRADFIWIFSEAGFENIHFRFTNHGVIPKLTRITWQELPIIRLRGLRYSDNILCIAKKPSTRNDPSP